MAIIGIDKGKLSVRASLSGSCRHKVTLFGLQDTDRLKKFFIEEKFGHIMYSSSTDFPEEEGAPADYDAHAVVQEALGITKRPDGLVSISNVDLDRIIQLAKEKGFYEDLKALDIQVYK